jgi:hypothetical protein
VNFCPQPDWIVFIIVQWFHYLIFPVPTNLIF